MWQCECICVIKKTIRFLIMLCLQNGLGTDTARTSW
jgi:hypothetical protein